MYSTLITAVALFAAPAFAAFAVNNPELKQCETAKISWEPTKGPYNVIVVDAANPCGEPLAEVGDFDKTFVNWKVTLPAGSVVQISVADSSDDEAWSDNITIGASSDSSCLATSSVAAGASSSASAAPSSETPSSPGGTPGSNGGAVSGGSDNTAESDTNGNLTPVGAANAGSNKFLDNAAPSARQLSGPALALSAIAAVAALAF